MRYCSARSISSDPFRAGWEIGKALAEHRPELLLVFASMAFEPDYSDFFDALYHALQNKSVIIFGGTGDGIFEQSGAEHYGVCAMGIASDGAMAWSTSLAEGLSSDCEGVAQRCARGLGPVDKESRPFCMVLADGDKADGHAIVAGISSVLPIPYWGGLTGGDQRLTRSRLFVNGKEYHDALGILLGRGPAHFAFHAASGWTPRGSRGLVEDHHRDEIRRISGQSAQEFLAAELGKPLSEADLGVLPLAIYHDNREHFSLRAPSRLEPESGAICVPGALERGAQIRVCAASSEDLLRGVQEAARPMLDNEALGFAPKAVVLVSSVGRKWLLADTGAKEMAAFYDSLGYYVPLIGFQSFGEISSFRRGNGGYSEVFFHNQTFVCCVMG